MRPPDMADRVVVADLGRSKDLLHLAAEGREFLRKAELGISFSTTRATWK